jgi:hypothetical protein
MDRSTGCLVDALIDQKVMKCSNWSIGRKFDTLTGKRIKKFNVLLMY